MFNKNTIQLTGNITKSAETRKAGDTTVTRARLIHNETIRKADGDTVERMVAVDLDIWGKRGEAFAEHITTKTPVYVEGSLQLDQWEQDGEPRSRLLVRVEDWQFLMAKSDSGKDDKTEKGDKAA
jgi:single-strand DNA-binding protein